MDRAFCPGEEPPVPANTSALLFRISAEWFALPTPPFRKWPSAGTVHSLPHRRQGIVLGLVNIRGELLDLCLPRPSAGAGAGALARGTAAPPTTGCWSPIGTAIGSFSRRMRSTASIAFKLQELQSPAGHPGAKPALSYTQGILCLAGTRVGLLDAELLFSAFNRSLT